MGYDAPIMGPNAADEPYGRLIAANDLLCVLEPIIALYAL